MKHKTSLGLFTSLILLMSFAFLPGTLAQEDDPLTRIDTLFTSSAERGTFSGSVLIAEGDEILLHSGYGYAVYQWDIPNTEDTRYRVMNQTELFIATSIMMLQERAMLNLDDSLCDYLENCPEIWQDISIHHLLSHSSGIPMLLDDISDLELELPQNSNQLIALLAEEALIFAPGDGFYYGSDYLLLGQLIKSASDQSYQVFIRQNILEPLALEDTGFDSPGEIVEHLAESYQNDRRIANYVHVSNLGSALGMYASVEDIYRFHQALRSGELVSGETWQTMSTSQVMLDENLSYGYAMWLGSLDEQPAIGDNWWGLGYSSSRLYLPDVDVTIIILTNLGEVDPDFYTRLTAQILLDEE